MDGLTFTSKLVEALAWPVVVLAGLYLFRPKLESLLNKLSAVKFGGAEVQFQAEAKKALVEVKELEVEAALPNQAPDVVHPQIGADIIELKRLYALSQPLAAVMMSWNRLESVLREIIQTNKVALRPSQDKNVGAWIREFQRQQVLPSNQINLLMELRDLRNQVAHGLTITPEAAGDFVESAERLITLLQATARASAPIETPVAE